MKTTPANRREFLQTALLSALGLGALRLMPSPARAEGTHPATVHSDEEWKSRLSPAQYDVLRHEGTERPFTSPLLDEHRDGVFHCVACDHPLFSSAAKFESGTGWPSFFDVLPGGIETKSDRTFLMERTEYHCAECGGHQGHIFDDGPKPTGLRYCNNGVALSFKLKSA